MTQQKMIEIIDSEIRTQNKLAYAEEQIYKNSKLAREHRSMRNGLTLAKIRLRNAWTEGQSTKEITVGEIMGGHEYLCTQIGEK